MGNYQAPGEIRRKINIGPILDPNSDTVAAIATPPGRGGVGIVRVSGPRTRDLGKSILGKLPSPREAVYQSFLDSSGVPIDMGIALFFPSPRSFTGEDVIELQAHGGPVVLDMLLERLYALGARAARPGEFSERAFLNGKLDLAQAEATADLIDSGSTQAARCAFRTLQGEFSLRVREFMETLVELRTYVEAAIDFPEEDVDFLARPQLDRDLSKSIDLLEDILAKAYQGHLLREGMTVVIAGQPNVGKSSLLNILAGKETAIVTDIPGTTRDLLREQILIDGMPVHVIDTAGLRETGNMVEQIGVRRAWEAIADSDMLILVVDDQFGMGEAERDILSRLPDGLELLVVHNKIDLTDSSPSITSESKGEAIHLSAATGEGLNILTEHLKGIMGFTGGGEGAYMARRRHLEALRGAGEWLTAARKHLADDQAGELVAEDLRRSQQRLGEITGEFTADDLLGGIFSSFCIGK